MSRPSPQTDRLIALVDLLAARPADGFTLAEIARGLGVGKATVHPMLTTLTRAGWLLRHPVRRTYRLGPALVAAGRAAAEGDPALDLARPVMRRLAADTGLGVLALVPGGDAAGEDDLRVGELVRTRGTGTTLGMRLGDRVRPRPPLGSVTVAWGGPQAVDTWLARLDTDPPTPGADSPAVSAARTALEPALAGIRARGWVLETESRMRDRLDSLVADLEIELGTGDWDSTGHAAALRRAIADIGRTFDPSDALPATVEPDTVYRVSSVNAPVFDPDGHVAVALCLIDHPEPLTGRAVTVLGERVRAAADEVTAALHGHEPEAPPPASG